jgi:L-ribulose-5-phosphate 3-epimerase UlaE
VCYSSGERLIKLCGLDVYMNEADGEKSMSFIGFWDQSLISSNRERMPPDLRN